MGMDRLETLRLSVSFLFAVALGSSATFGGIVEFSPANQNIDPFGDTVATFEVTVIPEIQGGVDSVDMIIGSDENLRFVDFEFSEEWCNMWGSCIPTPPQPIPTYDIYISSWSNWGLLEFDSLALGTIRYDAADVPNGVYTFGVDDVGFSVLGQLGVPVDPLHGSATVTVPEPTMIALLGAASLVFIRRRVA
jgi:hypothetical protein